MSDQSQNAPVYSAVSTTEHDGIKNLFKNGYVLVWIVFFSFSCR